MQRMLEKNGLLIIVNRDMDFHLGVCYTNLIKEFSGISQELVKKRGGDHMDRIRRSGSYQRTYSLSAQLYEEIAASKGKNNAQEMVNSKNHDIWEVSADWSGKVEEFLEQMEQEYSGISIVIGDAANCTSIPKLAAGLGGGTHLVVTGEFLKRMGSSKEEFFKCKTAMTEILEKLAGEAGKYLGNGAVLKEKSITPWSVPMPEKQESGLSFPASGQDAKYGFSTIDDWKRRFSVKYTNYGASVAYGRLAGASTKGQVRTVMSEAHRSMASLRLVVALGDDKDKVKARAAIGSLQKLLVRGKRKMRRLDEETLLKIKKNRAQKQNELKKARQMKQELERRRSSRHSADHALRAEGMLDDANRKLRFYDEKEQKYEAVMPVMLDAPLPSGADIEIAPAEGTFAASVVVTGAEISF